jgi:hypothetical protein
VWYCCQCQQRIFKRRSKLKKKELLEVEGNIASIHTINANVIKQMFASQEKILVAPNGIAVE